MTIVLNSSIGMCDSVKKNDDVVDIGNKCLELEAKFGKKNNAYNELQAKDTVISKLKETIHSLRENANPAKVKKNIDEIETINIELEHKLYNSIKPSRVHAKEQCNSLIANLNSKSMENEDLKAQIQEKVFANATLKNELRKLKGKNVIDTVVSKPNATTIAPGMFQLDIEPISHRLKNNRDAQEDYLKKTIENTETIRGLVECARKQNPIEPLLDPACVFTIHLQELLVYVSKTCLSLTKPSEKVRFADPITSSSNTQSQVNSHKIKDSNQPLLQFTRVICSTGASGSKPTSNTRNNRISQLSSSNKTNKV
ncbi:hypothetical protein Tco_1414101 [Tanacetum coccineum]